MESSQLQDNLIHKAKKGKSRLLETDNRMVTSAISWSPYPHGGAEAVTEVQPSLSIGSRSKYDYEISQIQSMCYVD